MRGETSKSDNMSIPIESATTITLASGADDGRVIVSESMQPYNYLYMAVTARTGGVIDANPTLRQLFSAISIQQPSNGSLSYRFSETGDGIGWLPLWCNLGWYRSDDCASSCSYDAAGSATALLYDNPSKDATTAYFYLPICWSPGQADTVINITAGTSDIEVRFAFSMVKKGMRGAFRAERGQAATASQMFLPQDGVVSTALLASTTGTGATFAYQDRADITNVSLSGVQRLTYNFPQFTLAGSMDAYLADTANGNSANYSDIAVNVFPDRSADFGNQPYIRQTTTAGTTWALWYMTPFSNSGRGY
jgi:hypothetical protein